MFFSRGIKTIELSDYTATTIILLSMVYLYCITVTTIKRLRDARLPICIAWIYMFEPFITPLVLFLCFFKEKRECV